jgi:hypothetical protein
MSAATAWRGSTPLNKTSLMAWVMGILERSQLD